MRPEVKDVRSMLKDYTYVAVWVSSEPRFAVDRSVSDKEISRLFDIYVRENEICWYDGSNLCEEL